MELDEENRTALLSFSSESEVSHWFGKLVLSHNPEHVDLNRLTDGAAFLFNHDWNQYLGDVQEAWIDKKERKGFARVKLSTNSKAEEIWQDWRAGLRKKISFGFDVRHMVLAEERADGDYVYRSELWEPYEISSVTVPADVTVGLDRGKDEKGLDSSRQVGRNDKNEERKKTGCPIGVEHDKGSGMTKDGGDEKGLDSCLRRNDKNEEGNKLDSSRQVGRNDKNEIEIDLSDDVNKQVRDIEESTGLKIVINNVARSQEETMDNERNEQMLKDNDVRTANIIEIARAFDGELKIDLMAKAAEFIRDGKSDAQFNSFILEQMQDPQAKKMPDTFLDMSEGEKREYSVLKVVRYLSGKDAVLDGIEREAHEAQAKKLGRAAKGVFIPLDIQHDMRFKRDLSAGGSTSGSELVGTIHRDDLMVDYLYNKMLVFALGATRLSGLVGNVAIPKLTAGATAAWVATEGAGASESTPTTGTLSLTAKEISANVDITRQLAIQGTPDAENLVRMDLMRQLSLGIDAAVYAGTGSSGQPTGIINTSGVGAVDLAGADWDAILEFEADIDTANALDGALNYVTTPAVRTALKGRTKAGDYPVFICSENNVMNGYPIFSTNQMSTGYMIFGDWSNVIVADWGVLDLIADQNAKTGIITIGAFMTTDIGVRQAGAFSVGSNFS